MPYLTIQEMFCLPGNGQLIDGIVRYPSATTYRNKHQRIKDSKSSPGRSGSPNSTLKMANHFIQILRLFFYSNEFRLKWKQKRFSFWRRDITGRRCGNSRCSFRHFHQLDSPQRYEYLNCFYCDSKTFSSLLASTT